MRVVSKNIRQKLLFLTSISLCCVRETFGTTFTILCIPKTTNTVTFTSNRHQMSTKTHDKHYVPYIDMSYLHFHTGRLTSGPQKPSTYVGDATMCSRTLQGARVFCAPTSSSRASPGAENQCPYPMSAVLEVVRTVSEAEPLDLASLNCVSQIRCFQFFLTCHSRLESVKEI